ncbi:MAG: thiosulfate oxidation carrier complex protein SoxZ [Proteobacteria bacterium]|nr:thiosulfate oxidation carrier complex protein SoxZ [Pseudomonadota bacterium]
MAIDIQPRIRVPKSLKKGEIFEVKTLVKHAMESGLRKDNKTGKAIPREIINRLQVSYNGDEVLNAVWHPGISANPYTSFFVAADKSGPMEFTWTDDLGKTHKKTVQVKVV